MPHISIEYSQNLDASVDVAGLCECLRATASSHDAFPMPGVRVRAYPAKHYAIADGGPQHGFIDILVRLREGRAPDVKKDASDALFSAAKNFLAPIFEQRSLALSLEIRDISADFAPKTGTIRAHLGEAI